MSLLAPLFLIATPLLALPVLLHFYKGRKPEAIEWGAMHFLVDAVNEGRRWEKLEELLLMLLRVLALAALVFALARPMAPGSWLGASPQRDVVMILDDSMSTAAVVGDEDGDSKPVIDSVKRFAHELIDQLGGDDRVQVLAASAGGRWLTADAVAATAVGRRRLHKLVDELKPTQGSADLVACVRSAARLSTSEESTAQKVWVFTDGQRRALSPDAEVAWKDLADMQADRDPPLTVQFVLGDATEAPGDNLSVASTEPAAYVLRANDRARVTASIQNLGDQQSGDASVKWLLDGKEVATSNVAPIAPGAEATARAAFRIKEPGTHLVECVIDKSDALALDQSRQMVLRVAKESPVLIVERADAAEPGDLSESQLLMAALGYEPGHDNQPDDDPAWRAAFRPETITPGRLHEVDLSRYAAVIVADADPLERADVERLVAYVATGGGVWIALDDQIEPERFNALWHDDGEGLCPVAVEELALEDLGDGLAAAGSSGAGPGVTIHPPSPDHPATVHLANTTGLDIDKARLDQHWRLARETPLGDPPAVLLESGVGDPLVVERYLGQGRVIVQATPLGFEWGNLPRLKAYVVMINDWLEYLSAPSRDRHNLAPGAPIVVKAPEDDRVLEAVVTTPTGDEVELASRPGLTNTVYRYTRTAMPGVYRVAFRAGDETLDESPFAAAREAEESDLRRATDDDLTRLTEWSGVSFGVEADADAVATGETASRQPAWWALLVALAALLVGELLLASHVGQRRTPPLVTPN